MDSISEIAEEKYQRIMEQSRNEISSIDYKLLYEKLLTKYEQSLIMIGSLEAQIKNLRSMGRGFQEQRKRNLYLPRKYCGFRFRGSKSCFSGGG
jgi:hypothetical protein